MKNVLFVSAGYFPADVRGAHRVYGFVKYLPDYGYNAFVICFETKPNDRYYSPALEVEK